MALTLNPANFHKIVARLEELEKSLAARGEEAVTAADLDVDALVAKVEAAVLPKVEELVAAAKVDEGNLAARIKATAVAAAEEAARAVVAEAEKPAPAKPFAPKPAAK